jgi:hypothetical protein
MGVVYKARDPVMDRFVAVKTVQGMALSGPQSKEYRERFYREARAAARLSHPGIVTVYDAGEQGDTPYMVMEFLEGRTLGDAIDSGERFTFDHIAELGQQMAEALGYAHRNGVVHRDIKPANILLTGNPERAKITDLGVAKLTTSQITTTGQLLGTPSFMAPEQILGVPVDGRADLFSLGVILYWMATGDKPFEGSTITAISYKIIHTDTIAPRKLNPTVPLALESIILKCLARDPAERYQSGEELATDLAAVRARDAVSETAAAAASAAPASSVLRGAPAATSATAMGQTLPISAAQETLGIGATAQTGLGMRTELASGPAGASLPANEPPAAKGGERRRRRVPLLILEAAAVLVLAIAVFIQFHHHGANPRTAPTATSPAASTALNLPASAPSDAGSAPASNSAVGGRESAGATGEGATAARAAAKDAGKGKLATAAKPAPRKPAEATNSAISSSSAKAAEAAAPAGTHAAAAGAGPPAQPNSAATSTPAPAPAIALTPDTAAKVHLDMGRIPPSLTLVLLMDGKPLYTRTAGVGDSGDQLVPPGSHSFQVISATGTTPLGASNTVSGDFKAKKNKTLRVELRDNSSGETLKRDSQISSGSATYILTLR